MKIRTVIVDDELPAREGIKLRLKEFPDIQIVGECSSGKEAVAAIQALQPDLLFLDIQMPEMNGFEILQAVQSPSVPIVIFITAYDTHAIKAFEVHALDYLLKPINKERFRKAVHFALTALNRRNLGLYAHKLQSAVNEYLVDTGDSPEEDAFGEVSNRKAYVDRLLIKSRGEIAMISVHEIDWIESAGDYVYVHVQSRKHIVRQTLASLENKMDPQRFVRIHRSTLVNLEKVANLRPNEHGDYDVYLRNGTKLKLSRTYWNHFQQLAGNAL
jgi:two-component system LytT family response regulator